MKIGKLDVDVRTTPTLGDHFVIKTKNSVEGDIVKAIFDVSQDVDGLGSLTLRITLDTAIKLAQFIDEHINETVATDKWTTFLK